MSAAVAATAVTVIPSDDKSGIVSPLTQREQVALLDAEGKIGAAQDNIRQGYHIIGTELARIQADKLYKGYGTFQAYCEGRWGFSRQHVYRILDATKVRANLEMSPMGDIFEMTDEPSERVIRPLTTFDDPDDQREAWERAKDSAAQEGKDPGARHTTAAVAEIKAERAAPMDRIAQPAEEEGARPGLLHTLTATTESARERRAGQGLPIFEGEGESYPETGGATKTMKDAADGNSVSAAITPAPYELLLDKLRIDGPIYFMYVPIVRFDGQKATQMFKIEEKLTGSGMRWVILTNNAIPNTSCNSPKGDAATLDGAKKKIAEFALTQTLDVPGFSSSSGGAGATND